MDVKWANYQDMRDLKDDTIQSTLEQCYRYCWDAVNLEFEYSSSTSGMYPKWHVRISMNCTVKDLRLRPPSGIGGSMDEAWIDLRDKMKVFCDTNNLN